VAVDLPRSTATRQPRPLDPIYLTVRSDLSLALGEETIERDGPRPALDGAAEGDEETRISSCGPMRTSRMAR
jgi:biopolymer transport protein ExbD